MILTYPGSFDPITNGHLNIIERALPLCEKLLVIVATNPVKQYKFTGREVLLERVLERCFPKEFGSKLELIVYQGIIPHLMVEQGSKVLLRGIRSSSDLEYEQELLQIYKSIDHEIEALYLLADPNCSTIRSSLVNQMIAVGGDINNYVPEEVIQKLKEEW